MRIFNLKSLPASREALITISTSSTLFLMSAMSVFAAPAPGTAAAQSFVATLNRVILIPLIGLLMGIAFLVFLFGAFEYIKGANNPTAREQGAKHITYGIIGLVIMISAWAILSLAANTFGLSV